ncbi:hypothetical protein DL767_004979 [Monosporascus sp. MG133]|nr:hypothetical protein DL767_004979 [Monosporascus sp. MG133]
MVASNLLNRLAALLGKVLDNLVNSSGLVPRTRTSTDVEVETTRSEVSSHQYRLTMGGKPRDSGAAGDEEDGEDEEDEEEGGTCCNRVPHSCCPYMLEATTLSHSVPE